MGAKGIGEEGGCPSTSQVIENIKRAYESIYTPREKFISEKNSDSSYKPSKLIRIFKE